MAQRRIDGVHRPARQKRKWDLFTVTMLILLAGVVLAHGVLVIPVFVDLGFTREAIQEVIHMTDTMGQFVFLITSTMFIIVCGIFLTLYALHRFFYVFFLIVLQMIGLTKPLARVKVLPVSVKSDPLSNRSIPIPIPAYTSIEEQPSSPLSKSVVRV